MFNDLDFSTSFQFIHLKVPLNYLMVKLCFYGLEQKLFSCFSFGLLDFVESCEAFENKLIFTAKMFPTEVTGKMFIIQH